MLARILRFKPRFPLTGARKKSYDLKDAYLPRAFRIVRPDVHQGAFGNQKRVYSMAAAHQISSLKWPALYGTGRPSMGWERPGALKLGQLHDD